MIWNFIRDIHKQGKKLPLRIQNFWHFSFLENSTVLKILPHNKVNIFKVKIFKAKVKNVQDQGKKKIDVTEEEVWRVTNNRVASHQ